MKKAKKALAILLCAALLVGGTIAGTVAYLTAKTGPVTNTFTSGNVAITLNETDVDDDTNENDNVTVDGVVRDTANAYHLIPGETYTKDPAVYVAANSEDSWIFVKVVNQLASYEAADNTIAAQIKANGWTELTKDSGIYYKSYTKATTEQKLPVFGTLTIDAAEQLGADWTAVSGKTITVTAYAVQASNGNNSTFSVEQAWAIAEKL